MAPRSRSAMQPKRPRYKFETLSALHWNQCPLSVGMRMASGSNVFPFADQVIHE